MYVLNKWRRLHTGCSDTARCRSDWAYTARLHRDVLCDAACDGFHDVCACSSECVCVSRGQHLLSNGMVISDKSQVSALWLQHWQAHFNAAPVAAGSFSHRTRMTNSHFSADDLSTQSHCALMLLILYGCCQRCHVGRLPDDVLAAAVTPLADLRPPLEKLFNQFAATCSVPRSYSGARVVPVWKRKGSPLHFVQELAVPRHAVWQRSPVWHCVSAGADASALARERNQPSASLFIDVTAAFDSVPLPLVWGAGPELSGDSEHFVKMGYSYVTAESMALFLHCHPCVLSQVGLPAAVVDLLRSWGPASWLVTAHDQSDALSAHSGVQGHNLAALIFDILYSELLVAVDRDLIAAGICISVPRCCSRSMVVMTFLFPC
eukprot:6492384-Amphidinium_carterae.14